MGITSLHYLAPVSVGGTALGGITATDNGVDSEIRDEPSSGELTARLQSLVAQGFRPTFSTQDLATALPLCGGSVGCSLAAKPLVMAAQAGSDDGRRATSGHVNFTYQHGLLLPESLECAHQGDATLSYQALVTWDQTHDPMVIGSAALPSISSTTLWTLYTATLGGVAIPQLQNVSIQFGIQAQAEGSDSDVWASKASVSAIRPVIRVTATRIAALIPLIGATGGISIVFRERADGGTFTGRRLTLSGSGMASFSRVFGASGGRPGDNTIEARPKYNGVTDPLVVSIG